jgi:hypothetical protein
VDNDAPHEKMNGKHKKKAVNGRKKEGHHEHDNALRSARNFWFYIFICSLSHTQILIEFIVTTFMFVVAFMFFSRSLQACQNCMEFYD